MLTGAAVFDVLNARGSDEPLDDRLQADALATGDLAHLDPHTIDPGWLTDDLNRPAPVRTGAVMRVHESRVDLGDGIRRDATSVLELDGPPPPADAGPATEYVATGRLQPYAVVVPEQGSEPMPVLVYLHGYNAGVDEAARIVPELIDGAMESGFLVVAPYARGDTFCKGIGEIDVLEVLDDVARAYAVDADRVHLVGFSAGAACVNYLAAYNPDRWASVTAIAGTNEVTAIAENFRHVPWHGVSGTADIGPLAQELFEALAAHGFEASLRTYPAKAHEFGQVRDAADEILARIASGRRTTDPGIVTFVKPADADLEQFGLVHDGAYWVSGIEPADDGYEQLPRVEALSSAIADVPIGIPSRQYVRVQSGDALGSRDASITRVSERGDIAGPSSAGHAELRSVFVAAYAVDLGRMGLAQAEHVNVETSADRDVRLSLLGIPHERILASVDGGPPLEVAVDDGVAVVTVPSGSHLLLIEPRF
jgi:pimeloyl-ACP methyl ester carboxylesterase